MKIQTRLMICLFLTVGGGFYYVLNWASGDLATRYAESMEESLVDTAHVLASVVSTTLGPNGEVRVPPFFSEAITAARERSFSAEIYSLTKKEVDLRIYFTNRTGRVIFDSHEEAVEEHYDQWRDVFLTLKGTYGARTTRQDPDDPNTTVLYVAAPILHKGEVVGSLTVCKPTTSSAVFIAHSKRKIIFIGGFAGLLVCLIGLITSYWVTRPIEKLTRYTKAICAGERAILPDLGNSEIGLMGAALEEMRTKLEGKEYVEQYVQTLTHEIKGPLSAIHGAAELLQEEMPPDRREKFLSNIQNESDRIKKVVDRLLLLSSVENRRGLKDSESIKVEEMLTEIVSSLRPQLEEKNVTIALESSGHHAVRGEAFLLRQAVYNLVHNALEFSPEGGAITLQVSEEDTQLVLRIQDLGTGIPDYAVGRVFDKFYSHKHSDSDRKGTGLGLTLVREVAELHGGSVDLKNRENSEGAEAVFRIEKIS